MTDLPDWCCASGCKKCPAWRDALCKTCKSQPAKPDRKTCQRCIDGAVRRARNRRQPTFRPRATALPREQRCTSCGNPRAPGLARCEPCRERARVNDIRYRARLAGLTPDEVDELVAGIGIDYTPIDEWLDRPRNKIVRALRRFEWADLDDISTVLNAPAWSADRRARDALSQTLCRLVRDKTIERRRTLSMTGRPMFEYRVSPGVCADPPMDFAVEAA